MAFDSTRGVTVMFGGDNGGGTYLGSTWEWNGTTWTLCSPATSPPARTLPSMAYDSTRRVTVLFGGYAPTSYLEGTWEWDGTNWTQKSSTSSPTPGVNHGMAFDSARHVTVLFGGYNFDLSSPYLDETWEWDGAGWTQCNPAVRPSGRFGHTLAFDSVRGAVVLAGGSAG